MSISEQIVHPPATFVLVHGAWHGGWCWRRVADRLTGKGHRVFTPTLTGVGERSHLADRSITLDTHVEDILNLLKWEGLTDAVLVGHSYAGMVIDYGDVVTGGGVLAWADLGLRLTERLLGPTVMLDTARYMNVDPPGREQRFYSGFEPRTKHGDGPILKTQHWLTAQRERPVTVADLARHAGLESRTFLRRFVAATGMKPSEYQQRLRMTRARELLEFSRTSVDQIAAAVGYDDVGGFRRVFRKIIGLTPSDYRRRFGRLASEKDPGRPIAEGRG